MGKRYIEGIAFGINICKLLVVYWCGGTKTSGIPINLTKLQSSHLDMLARGLLQYNKRFLEQCENDSNNKKVLSRLLLIKVSCYCYSNCVVIVHLFLCQNILM